jgi:hypothetical protein
VRSLPPLYYWKAKAQEGMGQANAAQESYSAYSAIRAQSGEDSLAKATLD